MIDMVNKYVIPAVVGYENELAQLILNKKALGGGIPCGLEEELLGKISKLADLLGKRLEHLSRQTIAVREIRDKLELARAYREKVCTAMNELRLVVDELELIISSKHWTLPTYAEMLNSVNE